MATQHHSNTGVSAIVQHIKGAIALLERNAETKAEPIGPEAQAEIAALEARLTDLLDEQPYTPAVTVQ